MPDNVRLGYILTNIVGRTIISHDAMSTIEVDPCPDPGCFSRVITYEATAKQITALQRISDSCEQDISVSKYVYLHVAISFVWLEHEKRQQVQRGRGRLRYQVSFAVVLNKSTDSNGCSLVQSSCFGWSKHTFLSFSDQIRFPFLLK